jgi:preprotein translocase subunit SecG
MYTFITVLIIITCVLLVLVVLVQNSKGGGLTSGFASSTQVMGVRKTGDFLEKLTWGLAFALIAFSLLSNFALPGSDTKGSNSLIQEQIDKADVPKAPAMNTAPSAPPASPATPANPPSTKK